MDMCVCSCDYVYVVDRVSDCVLANVHVYVYVYVDVYAHTVDAYMHTKMLMLK